MGFGGRYRRGVKGPMNASSSFFRVIEEPKVCFVRNSISSYPFFCSGVSSEGGIGGNREDIFASVAATSAAAVVVAVVSIIGLEASGQKNGRELGCRT